MLYSTIKTLITGIFIVTVSLTFAQENEKASKTDMLKMQVASLGEVNDTYAAVADSLYKVSKANKSRSTNYDLYLEYSNMAKDNRVNEKILLEQIIGTLEVKSRDIPLEEKYYEQKISNLKTEMKFLIKVIDNLNTPPLTRSDNIPTKNHNGNARKKATLKPVPVDSLTSFFHKNLSSCINSKPKMILDNQTWSYCTIDSHTEIVIITFHKEKTKYREIFCLSQSQLVYAKESQISDYENPLEWSCEYIIRDNKIVNYSSLGHGETERDDWEPESILKQWAARKDGYEKVKME